MAGPATSSSNYLYCFTHSNIGTSVQMTEKLKDLSHGITNKPPSGLKGRFSYLQGHSVLECVVGEKHVAVLLDDGRVFRMAYSEEMPHGSLSLLPPGKEKSDDDCGSTSSAQSLGSRSASPHPDLEDRPPTSSSNNASINNAWGSLRANHPGGVSSSGLRFNSRGRIWLRRRGGGARGLIARWPIIPASEVPSDLVDQAMSVLQDKSRDMVIRELQRTNLDVNQALNNLLSREDDDGGGEGAQDEGAGGMVGLSIPSGEELLSLLGSGLVGVGEEELEEALGRSRGDESSESTGGRESRVALYEFSDPLVQNELRSLVSIGDGAAGGGSSSATPSSIEGVALPPPPPPTSSASGSSRTGERNKRGSGSSRTKMAAPSSSGSKKKKDGPTGPLLFDRNLEWWGGAKGDVVFRHITGLHSQLYAVDSQGKLHGWLWSSSTPLPRPHPLEEELHIEKERIKLIAGKFLRASVVMESGKVATWTDSTVSGVASRLDLKAQSFPEIGGETITQLKVSEIVSAVVTETNKIFWWGLLPFTERKQSIIKNHDKIRQFKYHQVSSSSSASGLVQGSKVCLRSTPIYSAGGKAIHLKGTQLQCGILQSNIINPTLSEKCTFKLISGEEGKKEEEEMDHQASKVEPALMSLGSKRKYSDHFGDLDGSDGNSAGGKMEEWSLRDVIFVDHVTNLHIGSVVKLDGNYVAVHYPSLEEGQELSQVDIDKCRLLRREELMLVSEASSYHTPYFIQSTPRRLRPPPSHTLLTIACDSRGVHALYTVQNQLRYTLFNLDSGKFHQNSHFNELSSKYLIKEGGALQLVPINLSLGVILDKHGGLFPVSKNNIGNIRDLQLLNLPPVSCVNVGICSTRNSLVGVVVRKQVLMPAVLRCDLQAVQTILDQFKEVPSLLRSALKEHCSGGCNIFHVLAFMGKPPDPTPSNQGDKRGVSARTVPKGGMLREIMKQAMALASGGTGLAHGMDWMSEDGESLGDTLTAADTANDIVDLISSLYEYHDVLTQLLQEKNLDGYTPFMSAVAFQAYCTARILLDLAVQVSDDNESVLSSMLYPSDSHPDDNPVFVLCRNDPCSFTWTGEEHIQQDIFECRTCGLTGSLCCCTECAYNCHRGHDCSFKRASPTAYCDCWEGGKCQSLTSGGNYERKSLLNKLLSCSNLGTLVNAKKEHLLGMLCSTMVRQQKEQSHYTGLRSSSGYRSSRSHSDDIPMYDLPPPKFAQKALNIVMENWMCLKAILMCEGVCDEGVGVAKSQVNTTSLDAFTYLLLTKVNTKVLDSLLTMIVRHVGLNRDCPEGIEAANRFIRSVIRVFTVHQMETSSIPSSTSLITLTSRKKQSSTSPVMDRARRVFSSLAPLSLHQLVPMACSLILPVTMGITRPVDPFCMADRRETSDDMFGLPPLSLLRTPPCEEEGSGEGSLVDLDTESEIGDGEDDIVLVPPGMETGGVSINAGSNLLYLSDQDSSDPEDLDSVGDDVSVLDYHVEEEGLVETHSSSSRTTQDSHWALPSTRPSHSSHHHHHHHHHSARLSRTANSAHRSGYSVGASASLLAKTFSLLIRQLADTLNSTWDMVDTPTPPYVLPVMDSDPKNLYHYVWEGLEEVWGWLFKSMDVLESQLRFGTATCRKLVQQTPPHKSDSTSDLLQSRKDMFGYVLTLLRGQYEEHGGVLPALDMGAMEHLAWCFNALFYLLQHSRPPNSDHTQGTPSTDPSHMRFFHRSNSVVCLGTVPLSPFDPLTEALPLAEKPHLLDVTQDKEMLFGYQMSTLLQDWPECPLPESPLKSLLSRYSGGPAKMWPKQTRPSTSMGDLSIVLSHDEMCGWDSHKLTASVLIGRWGGCLEVFAQAFMETVGRQKDSVLSQEQHFKHREKDFRREMDCLRATCHKEIVMEVDRSREKFLPDLFTKLNHYYTTQPASSLSGTPPLCVHRVKVTFVGEPGEGSGVLRSMFTAAADAILLDEPLPWYDIVGTESGDVVAMDIGSEGGGRREGGKGGKVKTSGKGKSSNAAVTSDCGGPEPPLFYQPGKAGYYAPRTSASGNTALKMNAYRNVGRIIGLCLLHTEVLPITLCRHVFKYITSRQVSWHDLAFFDSAVYESLRKMILDSREENGAEVLASMGLTFTVTLSQEEGGGVHQLKEDGANVMVTPSNVYEYVKKYAELRMVEVAQESLQEMRRGVQEVVPKYLLSSLSAEDLRLILCGSPHIDVEVLRGITVFDDESHKELDTLSRFKGWFFAVLERMTQRERQDLLYFWSSSPVLPASVESYQPRPSVTIRPPDDQQFPTANTCISRLYLPLYSSKVILRARLLTAIKTKTFGFV